MARKKEKPDGDQPVERISQAEAARRIGMDPSQFKRQIKDEFLKRGLPGFYDDGVDFAELWRGQQRLSDIKAEAKAINAGDVDADAMGKIALAEKRLIEVQMIKAETVYIEDIIPAFEGSARAFTAAQRRLPARISTLLLAWLAVYLHKAITEKVPVGKALDMVQQKDLEDWLDMRLDEALPDMGKEMQSALRQAISNARIRAS